MVAETQVGAAVNAARLFPGFSLQPSVVSLCAGALLALLFLSNGASAATHVFIVAGLGGEPAYEKKFQEEATAIAAAAEKLTGDKARVKVLMGKDATRDNVRRDFRAFASATSPDDQAMVVLIGHGSFDGDDYRFNLPGPDLTGNELSQLFELISARDQLIVSATSASGAMADRWKRNRRVVVTATKSGGERTATRFGQYWVEALTSAEADVNKDQIVNANEAFQYASRKVADGFKSDVSLATEHSRLEGDTAARFTVARFGDAALYSNDPEVAKMLTERGTIERDLDAVKQKKATLVADQYYDQLEGVLVRLAMLQKKIDAKQTGLKSQ
jgi:hypothetical protein